MTTLMAPILAAGLEAKATPIFNNGTVVFTNSMVATWLGAFAICAFAVYAMRKHELVPSGAQNFAEWIVEGLANLLEGILGHKLMMKTFWYFGTVFIFIMSVNLFALIPGVGSVGWTNHPGTWYNLEHIPYPLFRGVNADLNMTLGMALIFFVCWFIWSFSEVGVVGFFTHLFGSRTPGVIGWLLFPIFIGVGAIEVISIIFRPVSLSLRLYGNIFGGENLLEAMFAVSPTFAPLILIPFYVFEIIVALVQALVFCLLTAAFTATMRGHDDHHDEAHGGDHGHDHSHAPGAAAHH